MELKIVVKKVAQLSFSELIAQASFRKQFFLPLHFQ
jgi:hypothetical protein